MKNFLLVLAVLLSVITAGRAQTPSKIYTSPKLPARDALHRMNLVVAWSARIKTVGQRDGLYSLQVIPGKKNAQVVAQTYEGAVYLFDAEHGDLIWKTKAGTPYWSPQPVGYNSQCIFAIRRSDLHVLDRTNGVQRVYTVDPRTRLATFGYDMGFSPSATPVGREDSLFLSMGNRVQALVIPDFLAEDRARNSQANIKKTPAKEADAIPSPYGDDKDSPDMPRVASLDSPQPELYWSHLMTPETTEFPPLVHGAQVSIVSSSGKLISLPRFGRGGRDVRFEFKMTGRNEAGAGQHGAVAYVPSDDFTLYAINMENGELDWRHLSGSPILQAPAVNDRHVYITPFRTGLRCLERQTGRALWTNRDATRFLAANYGNVYAVNRVGKFHVLDAARGTTLASYDLSGWAVPVVNELTDRIYLAADDGQILCLRHRDLTKPLAMKTALLPKKEEKKPEEKKEEKKEEEKKDAAHHLEPSPAVDRPLQLTAHAIETPSAAAEERRRPWAHP